MFTSDIFTINNMTFKFFDEKFENLPLEIPNNLLSDESKIESMIESASINVDFTPLKYTQIFPLERDFKPMFYKMMKYLSDKSPQIKRRYHFHCNVINLNISETDWYGINLRKLCIEANNEFQAWLTLEKYLHDNATYKDGSIYRLFSYKFFLRIYEDEISKKRGHILTVERIVKIFMILFKENNTLWYTFEGENDWIFKSLDKLCNFMCEYGENYRYMYIRENDELFAINIESLKL